MTFNICANCVHCYRPVMNVNDLKCKLFRYDTLSIPKKELKESPKIKNDYEKYYVEIEIVRFSDFDLCGENAKYYVPKKNS